MAVINGGKKYLLALLALSFFSGSAWSGGGIVLGATRIIYSQQARQVTIPVRNTSDEASYLVQSWVEEASGEKSKAFIVTPPLFKSGTKNENILRVIYNGKPLPQDRESLFYFNTKGIPAVDKSKITGTNALILATVTRVKLFMRPTGLSMPIEKAPASLRFRHDRNELKIINPSPYYLTLVGIKAGARDLGSVMVAPKSEASMPLPTGSRQDIAYSIINDYGGVSRVYKGIYQ